MSRPGTGSQAGAQRRVRALCARGWAPEQIERVTGLPAWMTGRILARRDTIRPETAEKVRSVFEQLWDKQPPQATGSEQAASARITAHARSRGWAPPLAWDDDVIDLPDGRPADGWKPGRGTAGMRRSADLAEDAAFVREHGGYGRAGNAEVALRLGVSRAALDKALSRTRQAETELEAG